MNSMLLVHGMLMQTNDYPPSSFVLVECDQRVRYSSSSLRFFVHKYIMAWGLWIAKILPFLSLQKVPSLFSHDKSQ